MTGTAHNRNVLVTFFSGLFILCLLAAVWLEAWYFIAIPFAGLFFYAGWQHSNAVFFLLLLSLPFSAELQVTSSLGTDFPDELLMLFTSGLFFCYWLYSPKTLPRATIQHPLIVLLVISFGWSIVSAAFSAYPVISLKFLLAKCWYFGAFVLAPLIVFRNKEMIKKAMLVLAIAMLVLTLVTMIRHYKYGFSFGGINLALKPFFRNHVNYSAMLVCIIPVFFGFYKLTRRGGIKNLLVLIMVGLIVALFFSYARGAWLALVVGITAWWLIRMRMILITFLMAILVAVASLFWIKAEDRYLEYAHDYRTTIFHEDFREHLRATYQFKDVSTAERFYRWIAGVRMIKENPLTGFGPATFYNTYKPYAIPAFKTWVSDNPEHSTVHNYFLMITVEQGIPGLLFFLLLTGTMLYYAQLLYHRVKDPFYRILAIVTGVIVVMILVINFLSDMIETDKVGSLFFLCLSMLIVTDTRSKQELLSNSN
ncbi:MAG TPA: O-antigen ligase family protein [Chitinophagaceae bacterium]